MSSLIPFTFNAVELKVVTIDGKEWCRAKEVCKALEYQKRKNEHHCSRENIRMHCLIQLRGSNRTWNPVKPSDSQKYDSKRSEVRKGIQTAPRRSSNGKAITDRDNKIQAIQYENVGLQGEIRAKDHQIARCENRIQDLIERHVPRRGVIDTVLSLIDKQCENEPHKFYMIRCQYKALNKHKKWLRKRYPNMIEKGESDDPNAVHRWCSFKKDFFRRENYYKNHFSMTEEQEELFETVFGIQI